jgi:hypothetical protein
MRAEGPIHLLSGLRTIWCRAFSPFPVWESLPWALPKAVIKLGHWPSNAAFGLIARTRSADGPQLLKIIDPPENRSSASATS